MTRKIEEVAHALREAVRNTPEGKSIPFEEMSMILARAAIEAMREPSDGMLDAAKPFGICMSALDDAYRTMIDAALREEGE